MIISELNITTKSGRKIINNLNLIVNAGDKVALIGEDGDGKGGSKGVRVNALWL